MNTRAVSAAVIVCLLWTGRSIAAPQTLEYTVLTLGNASGKEVVTIDGSLTSTTYSFNDRGRGPEITARWRVDNTGLPESIEFTGKSYMKTPIDERYERKSGGSARWNSNSEQGEVADAAGKFFLPINSSPAFSTTMIRALLRAPQNKLALLPVGQASARTVAEVTLTLKSGSQRKVRAIEVAGLGFMPSITWVDDQIRLFAQASSWFSIVQSGAEDTIPTLIAKQEELDAQRRAAMAEQFIKRPKVGLLVSNARVFDPRDLSVTPNTSILVIGNRIVDVGPDGSITAPTDVTRIDGGGRFLTPGLWDNHTHGDDVDGFLTLAAGITSVRDLANDETKLPDRKRRIDAGKEVGPRILLAGFIDGAGPFAGPTRARVSNEVEALKWIRWYAENGYEQIKVYSSLDTKLLPMIARETHARGMRLSGHVPAFMTAEQFIDAGADELQHLNFVFLNFLFDKAPDTRDMTRFTAVGKNASDIKPENARERRFVELLAKNRIVLDPTINVFEDMFNGASDKVSPGYEAVVARLPPTIARSMKGGNLPFATADAARVAGAMQSMKRFLRALHEAGVPLLPGSDSLGGFGFLRELELWDEAGIARAEILRAATLTSAQVNRRAHELGVIAPTMLADFVLIEGDPLARMADVRRANLVVKDGVAYSVADLQRAISVLPLP